jgi:IclR family acetate operon transcriptional repressor
MKALHREFSETVSLAMLFDHHIEVVATLESPQLVRMGNIVGRILPPHASSLGKAVTAFQDDARRVSLMGSYGLHRFTVRTLVDERELAAEFDRIRRDGYSLDAGESALEGYCFGAPIRDASGVTFAALSLSMPKSRLRPAALRTRIIAAVRRAADRISAAR